MGSIIKADNQKIEKYRGNESGEFSAHYTLEFRLSCKNCGGSKGRWLAASDGATSFDFLLTTCEYCGVFRFAVTCHARFYDNRDEKNLDHHKSNLNQEMTADHESKKRLEGPNVIIEKVVKGERLD